MRFTLSGGTIAALALLLLLAVRRVSDQGQQIQHHAHSLLELHERLDRSQNANELLEKEVERLRRRSTASALPATACPPPAETKPLAACPPPAAASAAQASSGGTAFHAANSSAGISDETLLAAHSRWDWREIAREVMQLFPRVEEEQLRTAVNHCNDNGTMYCQRLQIHRGSLYLTDYRAIFFDRHYAPSRILPLLETLRRHPNLPDIDIVVAGNDEPRVPAVPGDRYIWSRCEPSHQMCVCAAPAVSAPAVYRTSCLPQHCRSTAAPPTACSHLRSLPSAACRLHRA